MMLLPPFFKGDIFKSMSYLIAAVELNNTELGACTKLIRRISNYSRGKTKKILVKQDP